MANNPSARKRIRQTEKRNARNLDGWLVLEFTWRMITDDPEAFVRTVLQALAQR